MTTYIDDQDFSKVNYTGTWIRGGSTQEYNETVARTTIAVFGTFDITSKGVVTTYSVDGAAPAQVTSQAGSGDTHRQQFWRSDTLAIGEHKLLVNMSKVNFDPQPGEGTVWFDYFLVLDPTITSSGTPTPSPSQAESHTNIPVGAIVGAVIGGLFFLLAVGFIFVLYQRRTQIQIIEEKFDREAFLSGPGRHKRTTVQPFVLTMADVSAGGSASASTEFNPALLVSGPPPTGARKSVVTVRPGTGHSTQGSISNRADNVTYEVPITDEPVPSQPSRLAGATTHDATPQHSESEVPAKQRTRQLHVDVEVAPLASPTSSSRGPETSLLQHVDSGVRAPGLAIPDASRRVELPPVYSPI
ncbi:hypothetical protein FPV67DRAFT_1449744 [Lyophyllum atratum]|nr:hypothetical protein FPV67DRAFT_1449744 [Lyophyllum atratum]